MNWKTGIIFSIILCVLTVIVCIVIADELIGVEGTVGEAGINPDGEMEYVLNSNPAGGIICFAGLVLLPILFIRKLRVRYTLVNLPLYIAAWCFLDAIFGSSPKHGILSNVILIHGGILSAVLTAVVFWGVQAIVILAARGIVYLTSQRTKTE